MEAGRAIRRKHSGQERVGVEAQARELDTDRGEMISLACFEGRANRIS